MTYCGFFHTCFVNHLNPVHDQSVSPDPKVANQSSKGQPGILRYFLSSVYHQGDWILHSKSPIA
uniref:Uncharacterized protein n=1 Tax=Anguilla anguilla TaxID=7936 RepID=A0A0E9SLI0_ANGAN